MTITFNDALIREMGDWLEAAYPHEACGFMIGSVEGESRTVQQLVPVENRSTENLRRRFVIDPLDYLRAERQADEDQQVLLGVFHSHPDHPAVPSEHDLASAQPFFSYVIASIEAGSMTTIKSYRLRDAAFAEEILNITKESIVL
ncbi:MAG: M67 family metallopeptidase [Saprospiraceae bacterium]|nr:M67 family metallopeptidase [Saprospiraceae bacterium]